MSIKDLKVYAKATPEVKSQFASGELEELDTTLYSKAFSCLPLEKKLKNKPLVFLGFEWETRHNKAGESLSRGIWELKTPILNLLRKALSTPIANYINFRDENSSTLELVSIPATLGYHKRTLLKQFFANKLHYGFVSGVSCGFHVHIDNKALSVETVRNMIWLLSNPENSGFIGRVAGRRTDTHWCRPFPVTPQFTEGKLTGIGLTVEYNKHDGFSVPNIMISGKSCCLNVWSAFETCELRIFQSPKTYREICKNLEFTEAMVKFCKGKELDFITVENFKAFVKSKKRRYNHLSSFLKLK
jgi:hypothetical protein